MDGGTTGDAPQNEAQVRVTSSSDLANGGNTDHEAVDATDESASDISDVESSLCEDDAHSIGNADEELNVYDEDPSEEDLIEARIRLITAIKSESDRPTNKVSTHHYTFVLDRIGKSHSPFNSFHCSRSEYQANFKRGFMSPTALHRLRQSADVQLDHPEKVRAKTYLIPG